MIITKLPLSGPVEISALKTLRIWVSLGQVCDSPEWSAHLEKKSWRRHQESNQAHEYEDKCMSKSGFKRACFLQGREQNCHTSLHNVQNGGFGFIFDLFWKKQPKRKTSGRLAGRRRAETWTLRLCLQRLQQGARLCLTVGEKERRCSAYRGIYSHIKYRFSFRQAASAFCYGTFTALIMCQFILFWRSESRLRISLCVSVLLNLSQLYMYCSVNVTCCSYIPNVACCALMWE